MTSARRLTYRFWWALAFRSVVPWATSDLAENGELCDSRWVDTKAAPVTAQWPLSMWFCVTKVPLFNRETRMVPQASLLMVQSLLPGAKHLWVQSWLLQRFRGDVLHWSSVAIKPQHQVGLHPSRGTDKGPFLVITSLRPHVVFLLYSTPLSVSPWEIMWHPSKNTGVLRWTSWPLQVEWSERSLAAMPRPSLSLPEENWALMMWHTVATQTWRSFLEDTYFISAV